MRETKKILISYRLSPPVPFACLAFHDSNLTLRHVPRVCTVRWQALLKGKVFLGGSRPGAEDACVYAAACSLPSAVLANAPGVKGWLNTVGMFAPAMRGAWVAGASSNATGPQKAGGKGGARVVAAAAAATADKSRGVVETKDDGDVDSLFGDEDEGAEAPGGKPSRAEQMAAVKAEKDKKKKLDRSVRVCLPQVACIRALGGEGSRCRRRVG